MRIDIHSGSKDPRSARLSNFARRLFLFDGVQCICLEGVIQALKEFDPEVQKEICAMEGGLAKKAGSTRLSWREKQLLYWRDVVFVRSSREYQDLITNIYDSAYEQDSSFRTDLLAVGNSDLVHTIGTTNQAETVLTEVDFLYQLNRLRFRARRG